MKEGKVQAALNLLTQPNTGGILGLNDMMMYGDDQITIRLRNTHQVLFHQSMRFLQTGVPSYKQVWYADDSTAAGSHKTLRSGGMRSPPLALVMVISQTTIT